MSTKQVNSRTLQYEVAASSCRPFEADLIERAKSDPQAFGELYETHYGTILNYIYRHTVNVHLAEELTSSTFLKALQALPRYRHRAPFRAWLYRIATNEVRMHWRRDQKRRAKEKDPCWKLELERIYFTAQEGEDVGEREERMRTYAHLHESINRLPALYRTVLVLRYFEGLTYKEISAVLGRREGTVGVLVHRGVKRMRKFMHDDDATFSRESH